ncbi:MAG: D-alanyl-D-alanine carboxypeptidase DacC [Legionellaceae bacterium]
MGAPTDNARAEDSERLLNYGFRFFETHKVYTAGSSLQKVHIWQGKNREISVGVLKDVYLTTMPGQYPNIKITVSINNPLIAPITKGQTLGAIDFTLNNTKLATEPLVSLENNEKGGFFRQLIDSMSIKIKKLFS